MKYLVIGTTFIDIKGFPEGKFILDGRNTGHIEYVHGGVARNIAENLGRLGKEITFLSVIDQSPFGQAVVSRLRESRVRTDYMTEDPAGLGTWLAVFDDAGDVAASISRRSDMTALLSVFDQAGDEIFAGADGILLEIDIEKEIVDRVFSFAATYDIPVYAVISNMDYAMKYGAFYNPVSCLTCNGQEAEMLFGEELRSLEPEEIAGKLSLLLPRAGTGRKHAEERAADRMEEGIQNGKEGSDAAAERTGDRTKDGSFEEEGYRIERIVVTLGDRGAVYYDGVCQSSGVVPALPVEVLDTTGAGDAFFTGVSIGLTENKSLREACMFGAELSSMVISTRENVCPRQG